LPCKTRFGSYSRRARPSPTEIHEFLEADDLDQLLHALGLAFSSLLNEDKIPIEAPKTA
jgi:hypothetical protein